jgi:hypothetical protein
MFRSTVLRFVFCLSVAAAAAGCEDDPTVVPTPTPPATVTENYSGTVNRNGAVTHSFFTQFSGEVAATLTNLTPDGLTVGLGIGTWNGAICAITLANDQAVKTSVIVGNASIAASLCVRIFDVGNIADTEPAAYEITVVHR